MESQTAKHEINFANMGVQLVFKFNDSKTLPILAMLWLTSEENSYGLAAGRWFDGSSNAVMFEPGKNVNTLFQLDL